MAADAAHLNNWLRSQAGEVSMEDILSWLVRERLTFMHRELRGTDEGLLYAFPAAVVRTIEEYEDDRTPRRCLDMFPNRASYTIQNILIMRLPMWWVPGPSGDKPALYVKVERDSPNFYEEDEEEGCGEGYTCRIWHTVHYLKADSWEVSPGCTVAEGIE